MEKKVDPETPQEWQAAVDAAEFYLNMDSARQYGLLTGGPKVNADRCEEILRRGKRKGYVPAPMTELCEKFIGKSA
jgi:hypothetical protein